MAGSWMLIVVVSIYLFGMKRGARRTAAKHAVPQFKRLTSFVQTAEGLSQSRSQTHARCSLQKSENIIQTL
jgi:hypothetical protein